MREEPEPKRLKGTGVRFAYETLRDEILVACTFNPARFWMKRRWLSGFRCRAHPCAKP